MLSLLKVTLGKALSTQEARAGYIPSAVALLSIPQFSQQCFSDNFFKTLPLKIITKMDLGSYIFILEINFIGA